MIGRDPASASLNERLSPPPLPALIIFRHCEPARSAIVPSPERIPRHFRLYLSREPRLCSMTIVLPRSFPGSFSVAPRVQRIIAPVETLTGSCACSILAKRYIGAKRLGVDQKRCLSLSLLDFILLFSFNPPKSALKATTMSRQCVRFFKILKILGGRKLS